MCTCRSWLFHRNGQGGVAVTEGDMIPARIKCTESQILSIPLPPESLSFSLEVFDTMEDDDTRSFSLISTVGIESAHTLTDQDTDEFELVYDEERSECSRWDLSSSCSTSLPPSIHGYEYACGRRYHSYMSGRYPLPNDSGEQLREETEHALFLHLLVRTMTHKLEGTGVGWIANESITSEW